MTPLHPGRPPEPHDLWAAWSPDPLLAIGLAVVAGAYAAGLVRRRRPPRAGRSWCFIAGMLVVAVASLSPLEELSAALASAHMAQHLLLVLVAAPLLALSAPGDTLLLGTPSVVRRALTRARRRLQGSSALRATFGNPGALWLLHVGVLWFWHAAVPYQAALDSELLHAVEHASFLLTGWLFWAMLVDIGRRDRVSPGLGILLLFGAALQSAFLSVLLTFARTPWYPGYAGTTAAWGLSPLDDQRLAGALMWVPGGMVYLAAALTLLVVWVQRSDTPPAVRRTGSRLHRGTDRW